MPLKLFATVAFAALLAGCGSSNASHSSIAAQAQSAATVPVVTSFSTLNSFVKGVGGKYVSVQNLVPIGASPEDYQPAPQDIATLSNARLVVENGLGIEAWLQHTIASAGNANVRVLVLSNGLPHIQNNPHLWMDPVLARAYVGKIRDELIKIDPKHGAQYTRNAAAYDAKLISLQASIAKKIDTIPPKLRTMIVFHNAWLYYNRRFGIKTVGVIELSPGQDPNPSYIAHLVDLARQYHVRAVFSEPEYSPKLADTLARNAGINIVSNVYDDSIGTTPQVHDYISMLHYDTNVIVRALK